MLVPARLGGFDDGICAVALCYRFGRRRPSVTTPAKLRGVSDLREFFRTNQRPIYFVSPTAFNLLGIDRWVSSFRYVCHYDSFDGGHPSVFVPVDRRAPEFESIEDINNYLLRHPEVRRLVR